MGVQTAQEPIAPVNQSVHKILKSENFHTRELYKIMSGSDLMIIILSICGTIFNNEFFTHPTNIVTTGFFFYFLMLPLGIFTNYITQGTMIEIAEKYNFTSFANTAGYLNHLTLVKVLPYFFIMVALTKCCSAIVSINQIMTQLLLIYHSQNTVITDPLSLTWAFIIPMFFIYLLYIKQTNFFTYFYISNFFAIVFVLLFISSELFINRIEIFADFMDKEHNWWIKPKNMISTYFTILATTSLKGKLFSIYKGLKMNKSRLMNKFIFISFYSCSLIYPILAGFGYFIYIENDKILSGKNFLDGYFAYNWQNPSIIYQIVLFLSMMMRVSVLVTNFLSIRGFFLKYFTIPQNKEITKVNKKIDRINRKIFILVHVMIYFFLIGFNGILIYKGNSIKLITIFNVTFLFPVVFNIIPLKIRYRYDKTKRVKVVFMMVSVAYVTGIMLFFYNL